MFSFLVLHGANLGTTSREFRCLREGDYLCDSCSGWTETVRTPFHLVAPPETLEVTKLFPESLSISSCDLMWSCRCTCSECSPRAGAKGTDEIKTPASLPSRGNQVPGQTDYFSPVWLRHTDTPLLCGRQDLNDMCTWTSSERTKQSSKWGICTWEGDEFLYDGLFWNVTPEVVFFF